MRSISFEQLISIIRTNDLQRSQGVCGINACWRLTCIDMTEKRVVQFWLFTYLYDT